MGVIAVYWKYPLDFGVQRNCENAIQWTQYSCDQGTATQTYRALRVIWSEMLLKRERKLSRSYFERRYSAWQRNIRLTFTSSSQRTSINISQRSLYSERPVLAGSIFGALAARFQSFLMMWWGESCPLCWFYCSTSSRNRVSILYSFSTSERMESWVSWIEFPESMGKAPGEKKPKRQDAARSYNVPQYIRLSSISGNV